MQVQQETDGKPVGKCLSPVIAQSMHVCTHKQTTLKQNATTVHRIGNGGTTT